MAANISQAVKQAMQDLIAPQLESLKGEIGAVKADIGTVRAKLGAVRSEFGAELGAVKVELGAVRTELGAELRRIDDKLTWALDLRERIVALETRLGPAPARS